MYKLPLKDAVDAISRNYLRGPEKIAVGALKSISYEIIYELARTTWMPVTTLAQLSAIDGCF